MKIDPPPDDDIPDHRAKDCPELIRRAVFQACAPFMGEKLDAWLRLKIAAAIRSGLRRMGRPDVVTVTVEDHGTQGAIAVDLAGGVVGLYVVDASGAREMVA